MLVVVCLCCLSIMANFVSYFRLLNLYPCPRFHVLWSTVVRVAQSLDSCCKFSVGTSGQPSKRVSDLDGFWAFHGVGAVAKTCLLPIIAPATPGPPIATCKGCWSTSATKGPCTCHARATRCALDKMHHVVARRVRQDASLCF